MSDEPTPDRFERLEDVPEDPVLHNEDLKPATADERTWNKWNLAALWVAMSISIPTYMVASQFVLADGMNWWHVMAAVILGNLVVLVPMILNGHAGTKYGIPFPVFARASFGVFGSHVPSIARAVVACAWFGIQTYVGATAISAIIGLTWGEGWEQLGGDHQFLGMSLELWISFAIFWAMNIWFVWKGHESIKWLENLAAPFLIVIGLLLLWWAVAETGGFGTLFAEASQLDGESDQTTLQWLGQVFLPAVTAMVGFWATLSLNIPDFTRYCRDQKEQIAGQSLGLPTTMAFFSFIAIMVTSAALLTFDPELFEGEDSLEIWNPVDIVMLIIDDSSFLVAFLAMVALAVATLSTNIAANVVAPANSFSNAFPDYISFRTGGVIAGVIGVLLCPWLIADALEDLLLTYSGLLGPVGGILIADYWLLRRTRLDVDALYRSEGVYRYRKGFNVKAILALLAGVAVVLVGLVHPTLRFLFDGAWFTGFAVALVVYTLLMRGEIDVPDEPSGEV